jgi:aspartate kinase
MAVVVQKYGGTSLDGPERIRHVAGRLVATRRTGVDVIAVASAMGHTTDEMIRLAHTVHPSPPQRELDMLVTAGERMAMALLAMAIDALGERAISFTGSQSGIITSSAHGNARIVEVRPIRIRESLAEGRIVIVAGYQGVSAEKEVTTLGRGGSDLSAVAIAEVFQAERCELFKDVPGVMTANPHVVPDAVLVRAMSLSAMISLARAGAGVVYEEAARFALEKRVSLHVASSFVDEPGTTLGLDDPSPEAAYAVTSQDLGDGTHRVSLVAAPARLDAIEAAPALVRGRCTRNEPHRSSWVAPSTSEAHEVLTTLHRKVVLPSR